MLSPMHWFFLAAATLAQLGCGADTETRHTTATSAPTIAPTGLSYPWLDIVPPGNRLAQRFTPPAGCQRVPAAPGSWGEWLRWLPLHPPGTLARHFDGQPKSNSDVVAAVLNIDVGNQDLQQCADAVIRLRGEYLFTQAPDQVHFHLTTGYDFHFSDYIAGRTFRVADNEVLPAARPSEPPTHAALARYFIPTFGYAGTLSLSRELTPVPLPDAQPGDVLIHGGSPGHAVLVLDVAKNTTTHEKYLLLGQSYMPAQSIHVLQNIYAPSPTAWFAVPTASNETWFGTPEWSFYTTELARF